jgi:ATP-dependent helicase/nuclease subunit B
MPKRIYLGYSAPFLSSLTTYLLQDPQSLTESLVVVPTSQSGRILRENLAAEAGALLAPTVTTPGALLHLEDSTIAPRWLEKIAWMDVLENLNQSDWENYPGLFPTPPDLEILSSDWATALATEIVSLRATLEESLHNLFSASKFLQGTTEGDRWENLAQLESLMEKKLYAWGYQSRSQALRTSFQLPSHFKKIILAGVTEMPICIIQALKDFTGEVIVLIPAPESEAAHFDELGIPLSTWTDRSLPESVTASLVADPSSQAQAALNTIATLGASSQEIAIGSADDEAGSALAHLLTHQGWPAFHPASQQPLPPLQRWLLVWKKWLTQPTSRNCAALLTFPECANLISENRAKLLLDLNQYRDRHPIIEPDAIVDRLSNTERPELRILRDDIANLLSHRDAFLKQPFPQAMNQHLDLIEIDPETSANTLSGITDFIEAATALFTSLKRSHLFWLQMVISEIPRAPAQPLLDRSIDIQGWLELLYEPGKHLLITGMNEAFIPARPGGEPWLSEKIRNALKLNNLTDRQARDAFLLHAMIRMREEIGSTHLFCGKNGSNGETYLPSSLLLKVPKNQLVTTVNNLFREIEPPEANLIWTRDLIWQTPKVELPEKLSVTSFSDYLACPFRFYLKHIVRASLPEPDRREMNHRDFGSITHKVLEIWSKDPEARKLSDPKFLTAYLDDVLDRTIFGQFGNQPPLAVRIQVHSIRQRLAWFVSKQVESITAGWEIIDAERKISFDSAGLKINGTIDRIDRHRETGQLRVIDYKTGKVEKTESQHRKKITAKTQIPPHINDTSPVRHTALDGKGISDFLWINLQLPLYALAESENSTGVPIPCYIKLGSTEKEVDFVEWSSFTQEDLESAKACMDWIATSISQKIFWPPAPKVKYDDYTLLSQNASATEAFSEI